MATITAAENFILKAAQLASSAPQAWEQFTRAVYEHLLVLQDQQTEAPRELLEIAQGRTQAIKGLLNTCNTCVAKAQVIQQKMNKEQPR